MVRIKRKDLPVSQIHLEYKEKMNFTYTNFFKISEKYDYNDYFLTQNLKKFQQNQEKIQDSFTNVLEKLDFNGELKEKSCRQPSSPRI